MYLNDWVLKKTSLKVKQCIKSYVKFPQLSGIKILCSLRFQCSIFKAIWITNYCIIITRAWNGNIKIVPDKLSYFSFSDVKHMFRSNTYILLEIMIPEYNPNFYHKCECEFLYYAFRHNPLFPEPILKISKRLLTYTQTVPRTNASKNSTKKERQ